MILKKNIKRYLDKLIETINSLNMGELEQFFGLLKKCYEEERSIFVFGNGGSAATASHFATDLNKGVSFGLDKKFKVMALTDNISTMLAYGNDTGYENIFVEQLKNFIKKGDLVVGISGSGNSPNVIKAIEFANDFGAVTVGITGYDGGKLKKTAMYSVNANVNDMQISEDIHIILSHLTMRLFCIGLK